MAGTIIITGCGGGGGGETQGVTAPPVTGPPSSGGNTAPEITGAPAVAGVVGQAYSFQPTATDADSDKITFSITSKPGWAQFDTATGRLWGTPTAADIGVHESIEIAASDGKTSAGLPPFAIIVSATANPNAVALGWDPPTQNEDGSPLTDLTGYRVYYGSATQNYAGSIQLDNPNLGAYSVENLPDGKYYFAITAMNASGVESVFSTEVTTTVN